MASEVSESPAERLAQAIRDVVGDTTRADDGQAQKKPNFADALFLFVAVLDVWLFLWLVPAEYLDSKQFERLEKIIPWLGTYVFALGYTWFSQQLLGLGKKKWFRLSLLGTLVFLILFLAPLWYLPVQVSPSDAELLIDDDPTVVTEEGGVWLDFRSHRLRLVSAGAAEEQGRQFEVTRAQLFSALWTRNSVFPMAQIYKVDVGFSDEAPSGCTVWVRKEDGEFDSDFLERYMRREKIAGLLIRSPGQRSQVLMRKTEGTIHLPFGIYTFTGKRLGTPSCVAQEKKLDLTLPPGNATTAVVLEGKP